jgi:magnesium-transporting ATPase (P-type)
LENRGAVEPRNFDPEERTDLLLRHLGTRREGLSEREAARRLEQHGPNEIRRREGDNHLVAFVRQFTHPLALLLWAAALLAFLGDAVPLALAFVAVIVLNAVFAFVQELQAEKVTEALKRYLSPLQAIFGTNALGWRELAILAVFPFLVWGSDELRRWALRRREGTKRVASEDGSRLPKRGER